MSSRNDLNCFCALGIDPLQKRYLMLKSRIHWRAGLRRDGEGCRRMRRHTASAPRTTASSPSSNVRRPIYPLDLINE